MDQITLDSRGLNQPLSNLTREVCQLLCILRCKLTRPMIIVIEKVNPSIMPAINSFLQQYFPSTTILFIGFHLLNKDHFNVDRVIDLDTHNKPIIEESNE